MKKLKMFLGLVGIISILAMSISCNNGVNPEDNSGKSEPGVASQTGSIKGKVLYSNSNDSSDILVCVEKTNGGVAQSVRELARSAVARSSFITKKASKDGTYSFDDLEPGTYTVYASSDYSKEKAVTTDVVVKANNTATAADLKLTATGNISGKVILDGTSTDNAGFIVCVSGTSYLAVTADDGSYTIYDIPAGQEYSLSVVFGTFVASKKTTAKVEAKNTAKAADIKISTTEIKANMLNGDSNGSGVTYTFDIIDEAGTKSDLPYNLWGENYQRGYDFVNYTNKRMIKSGDTVNVKARITSDIDISSLNCVIVDNNNSEWRVLTSEGKYVVAKNIKAGKAFDIDLSVEILADQVEQFYIVLQTDDLAACKKAPNLTFTRVTESTDTYYGVNAPTNKYVSATATDRGIYFSGTIPSNIIYTYTRNESYGSYTTTTNAETHCTIDITENENDIVMKMDDWKTAGGYNSWNMTYPLVEAGKEYNFTVRVYYNNYTFYEEKIIIKATGGLGEFKVENVEDLGVELTDDKVIRRTGKPEFTKNDKVLIKRQGTIYNLYAYKEIPENSGQFWNGVWVAGDTVYGDYDTYPVDDMNYIRGWGGDWPSILLSGHKYGIRAKTKIEIGGYTDDDNSYFEMNDQKFGYGEWGGEKLNILSVYGYDLDGVEYKEFTLKDKNDKVCAEITGMPGTEHGDYPYSEVYDILDTRYEPVTLPKVHIIDSEACDGLTDENFRFEKWNVVYPIGGGSWSYSGKFEDNIVVIDGERYLVQCVYAQFEEVYTHTVNFMMNDGTDAVYVTKKLSTEKAANYDSYPTWNDIGNYISNVIKAPVRDGYRFIGWYFDKECTEAATGRIYEDKTVYAKWVKILTATLMDGNTKLGTEEFITGESLKTTPNAAEGFVFSGWYMDKDLKTLFNGSVSENVTVYAKFTKLELLIADINSDEKKIEASTLSNLDVDDTLYFEIYAKDSYSTYDGRYGIGSSYGNYYSISYEEIKPNQTKIVSKTYTSKETELIKSIRNLVLTVYTGNTNVIIKNIYYIKGPRVKLSIYDGTKLFQTLEVAPNTQVTIPSSLMLNEGVLLEGLYYDSVYEKPWGYYVSEDDLTVYAKFIQSEVWWSGSSYYISLYNGAVDFSKLAIGDSLYFVNERNVRDFKEVEMYLGDKNGNYSKYIPFSINAGETKYIQYRFTSNDSYLIEKIKEYGLYLCTENSSVNLAQILYVKGN